MLCWISVQLASGRDPREGREMAGSPRMRSPKSFDDLIHDDELGKLLKTESHRGQVLISAQHIDNLLALLLKTWLFHSPVKPNDDDELFDRESSPCGNFSSRIKLAFRLGLIDSELKSMLDAIRNIRNFFAHQIETAHWGSAQLAKYTNSFFKIAAFITTLKSSEPTDEEVFRSAAMVCSSTLKITIGFCEQVITKQKRLEIQKIAFASIDEQIWITREMDRMLEFFKKIDTFEHDPTMQEWFLQNEAYLLKILERRQAKQSLGLEDVYAYELNIPLSEAERSLRKRILDKLESLESKSST